MTTTHARIHQSGTGSQDVQPLVDEERLLVESCLRGERDSQQQLYELHCDRVYRLMCRMVGSSNAEDLTQQVFLCAFQKLDKFHGLSSFATWLYRLASNEALQYLRRHQRDANHTILSDPTDEHSDRTLQMDERDLLEWALARLDPELRTIFLLREIENLAYYDIAMTLDIAEGTVASRLNRARRHLRGLINEGTDSR